MVGAVELKAQIVEFNMSGCTTTPASLILVYYQQENNKPWADVASPRLVPQWLYNLFTNDGTAKKENGSRDTRLDTKWQLTGGSDLGIKRGGTPANSRGRAYFRDNGGSISIIDHTGVNTETSVVFVVPEKGWKPYVQARTMGREIPIAITFREASSFHPQADSGEGQCEREKRDPSISGEPEYFSLGGLALGCCFNLLGGWLNLYDDRRPLWTGRRLFGAFMMVMGWITGFGGLYLSALNGGGY